MRKQSFASNDLNMIITRTNEGCSKCLLQSSRFHAPTTSFKSCNYNTLELSDGCDIVISASLIEINIIHLESRYIGISRCRGVRRSKSLFGGLFLCVCIWIVLIDDFSTVSYKVKSVAHLLEGTWILTGLATYFTVLFIWFYKLTFLFGEHRMEVRSNTYHPAIANETKPR
jgi:hypothetical protein